MPSSIDDARKVWTSDLMPPLPMQDILYGLHIVFEHVFDDFMKYYGGLQGEDEVVHMTNSPQGSFS